MSPNVAILLVICLMLLIAIYVLGVEVGKASTLLAHPGSLSL